MSCTPLQNFRQESPAKNIPSFVSSKRGVPTHHGITCNASDAHDSTCTAPTLYDGSVSSTLTVTHASHLHLTTANSMDKPWIKRQTWLTPYKPLHRPAVAPSLTPKEKAQIAYFREFRARCREGPYFTELRSNAKVSKPTDGQKSSARSFDGFEGLKTYTNKYRRKARATPRVDTRPHYKYLITVEGGKQCALAEVNQDLHTKDLCDFAYEG